MNLTIRSSCALLLTAVLCFGMFAGCSDGGASSSVAESAAAAPPSAAASSTALSEASAPAAEPITITYSAHVANMKDQEPATWKVMQKFMELNPNIKLDITGEETDEHVKKMKMAAQSGTLPDIFWLLPAPAQEMHDAGVLLDFNDFLKSYPEIEQKMGESLRATSSVDDAVIGLPYQLLVTGLWYNKALFKQYNVPEPKPGTTMEEFLEMIKAFKQNGVPTISQGAKSPFSCWNFLLGWARYGYFGRYDKIMSGEDSFVNDDFTHYFDKIDQMRQAGAFPENISTMDYFQSVDLFTSGKVAMLDSGVWDTDKINEALGEDTGFWWGPVFTDGVGEQKLSMKAFTNTIRVNKNVADDAAKKEAVYKFLAYFYSAEADQIRADSGSAPLVNIVDTSKANPAFKAVLEAMNLTDWPSVPDQADLVVKEPVQVAMYDAIFGIMCGTYTPGDALAKIEEAQARERE